MTLQLALKITLLMLLCMTAAGELFRTVEAEMQKARVSIIASVHWV